MKKKTVKTSAKKALCLSVAFSMAFSGMPETKFFDLNSAIVKAADTTQTIDSNATVLQIDSKDKSRPGIPDGTLLNELKRLVNTSLGRDVSKDITYGELMAYSGEIDLSSLGGQITSISGLGYARKASKIVLTNVSVKAIEDYEFDGCTGLKAIVLPEGVESIGKCAFRNCNQLTDIKLPNTVTSIGEAAFDTCISLVELELPAGMNNISKSAFSGCTSLKEMTIPNANIALGASVFEGCQNLKTVHLPEGITEIPASFFATSGITMIELPTTVKKIGQSAFSSTLSLPSIDLKGCTKLEVIGSNAFARSAIKTISLPESLITIKNNAFDTSSLTEITIPDSVKGAGDGSTEGGIESNAFWNCRYLKKVSIPSGVSVLQKEVFRGCWNLTEVTIRNPESSVLEIIEESAFSECNQLSNTDFLKDLKNLKTIKDNAFQYEKIKDEDEKLTYAIVTGTLCLLEDKDVYGDDVYTKGLQSVILPNSVTTLGNNVFTGQPNLKKVTLGNGLTTIPAEAFKDCVKLEQVTLPSYLKSIGENAFSGCIRLQNVTFPDTLETIGKAAFSDCGAVKEMEPVYYHVRYVEAKNTYESRPAGNTTAVECLIYQSDEKYNQSLTTKFFESGSMLTEEEYTKNGEPSGYEKYVILAEKRYAKTENVSFSENGNTSFTNYVFDENTERITQSRMVYSDDLNSNENTVYAPKDGYTGYFVRGSLYNKISIRDNYGMTSISLPNSVKTIGEKAFYNCYNLENIALSNQMTDIPASAFALETKEKTNQYDWLATEQEPLLEYYITKRKVTLPNGVTSIGNCAFQNNSNLELANGALPSNLRIIGDSAFEECKCTKSIIIPSKTVSIGQKAFYGCSEYKETEDTIGGYKVIIMKKGSGLIEIDLTQASSLEDIGSYAFSVNAITQCTLPKNVTQVSQGLFATCPYLAKVICSDDTNAIKADVFSNCNSLVTITVPAKATISYNAFRGYSYGDFSFVITDPDPISVSTGEEEKLPANTFLKDYLRSEVEVKEKNGTTGFVDIVDGETESINDWNIYKAKVKGLKQGTTKLTVTGTNNYYLYDDKVIPKAIEVNVTVNVTKKKCTAIKDTRDSLVLNVEDKGKQARLQPQVLPEDCSEANEWQIGNEAIVNVEPDTYMADGQMVTSSSAVVVPKILGTSKVTLKVGSMKKDYQVNVVIPATNLSLDKQTIEAKEGTKDTFKLNATMNYDTAKYSATDWENYHDIIAYSSADPSIASVSDDGVVTLGKAGTTIVTATALGSGKTATCQVTVLPDETMVYFTDENGQVLDTSKTLRIQANDTITLNIATKPVDSLSELTYEFSDMSQEGMFSYLTSKTRPVSTEDKGTQDKVISMEFSAKKIGTGTITVLPKSYKNKAAVAASINVEVVADTKEAAFVTISEMEVGTEKSVFGYLLSSLGKAEKVEDIKNVTTDNVTFVSSDTSVASMDPATGMVKAERAGFVIISMQILNPYDDNKHKVVSLSLEIKQPVATDVIVVEKNQANVVEVGKTLQLQTTLVPSNAKDKVTFECLTPNIASVDANGVITGKSAGVGIVKITTSEKQISKEFKFTVKGMASKTDKVTVKKVSGIKIKNVKGKKLKVTWKKVSGVNGYRITYALNSKFTKGKKTVQVSKKNTSRVLTKLKKGKYYYVKIQAYKKTGSKKVYGKVGVVKKIKVKK